MDVPGIPPVTVGVGAHALRAGVVSTVGNVREHNEDNYYVPGRGSLRHDRGGLSSTDTAWPGIPKTGATTTMDTRMPTAFDSSAEFSVEGPENLFIVADGMGGQLAGEKASQMAVELIPRELKKRLAGATEEKEIVGAIQEAVTRANDEILVLSGVGAEHANMGTTVVLALFERDRVYTLGIGDSRVYRLRGEKIEQLTRDHSLANALGEAGTIRPEEVETHRYRHILYLYLGSKDARDGMEEIKSHDVRAGDMYLLATDGLMNVVRDEAIADIMRSVPDPQRAAQLLVTRALENGSKDNVTCVVIHVVS